jgi:protein ImuB
MPADTAQVEVLSRPQRTVAVWCPDWPVTAARLTARLSTDVPLAVMTGNRVVALSHQARVAGIRRGLRRREAQARCPELVLLPRDDGSEARLFEPIVGALESIAPGVEITRPGLAALGMRGPSRYFGGEEGVLHALSRALAQLSIGAERVSERPTSSSHSDPADTATDVLLGVADGAFAAEQAARRGLVVPPSGSAAFLADLPVTVLDPFGDSPLIDLLKRLGLRTLGAFAALSARDVLARFGPAGLWAYRQAGGQDDRPVAARRPPASFTSELQLEPAVDRVDVVAFSARGLAEQFITDLAAHGLACTCLELQARTENGEETLRRWRHAGVLSTVDVVDRIRWQLEGWLAGSMTARPTGGVVKLRLVPVDTVPMGAHQQALWGGSGVEDDRAHRALARVQTLLGHGSVLTVVLDGGRSPVERTRLVPWGDDPAPVRAPQQPWPGHLPPPAPSILINPPRPVQVLDAAGHPVVVSKRGAVPAPPATLTVPGQRSTAITSWAGPWPVDERWWQPDAAQAVARFQLVDVHGRAYLVACELHVAESPRWTMEALYD